MRLPVTFVFTFAKRELKENRRETQRQKKRGRGRERVRGRERRRRRTENATVRSSICRFHVKIGQMISKSRTRNLGLSTLADFKKILSYIFK